MSIPIKKIKPAEDAIKRDNCCELDNYVCCQSAEKRVVQNISFNRIDESTRLFFSSPCMLSEFEEDKNLLK